MLLQYRERSALNFPYCTFGQLFSEKFNVNKDKYIKDKYIIMLYLVCF